MPVYGGKALFQRRFHVRHHLARRERMPRNADALCLLLRRRNAMVTRKRHDHVLQTKRPTAGLLGLAHEIENGKGIVDTGQGLLHDIIYRPHVTALDHDRPGDGILDTLRIAAGQIAMKTRLVTNPATSTREGRGHRFVADTRTVTAVQSHTANPRVSEV